MDEFLILLQAKLDEAKSKKLINADIDKIQKELDKLKLQAEIDPETISSLTKQLEGVLKQKITISDIGIDTSKVTKAGQRLGSELNKSISDGTAKSSNTLNNFRKSLQNIGMDSKSIDVVADRINQLGVQIDSLNQAKTHTPNKDILSVNISGVDQLGQAIKLTEQYDISTGILIKSIDDVSTAQQKMTSSFERDVVTYTNRLNDLQTKYSNASIDYSEFEKSFNSFKNGEITVNQLSIAFNQLENSAKLGVQSLKSQTSSFDPIQQTLNNMRNLSSMIKMLETNIDGLKDKSSLANVSVEELTSTYQELSTVMDSVGGKVPITEEWTTKYRNLMATVTSLTEKVETLKKVEASDNSAVKLAERIREINRLMDNGFGASEYQNRIDTITASLEKYGVETQQAKDITNSLQSTFDSMKGLSGKELVLQADTLEQGFKAAKVSVEQAKNAYDKYMQPVTNEKATTLINRINTFLSKNTKITKEAKIELEGYIQELNKGVSLNRWNDINLTLKKTENSMRGLHRLGASLKDQMSQAAQSFTQWLSVSSAVMLLLNQLRKMPREVYEIDTAMTNLYKVTDEANSKYTAFLNSASKSAHELGRSISSLVDQTANWAKLGFSLDEAEQLAKISSVYANVGEVDDDTAVSDMVTAMKAFNIEASDSITIVDKLNKLGNEYATSAAALGDGLSHSASAMATSGTDINKTLAMLTGGTEITQNASEFGNFLKIGSMRIRGMKGALEALGEEVDETVDSISKVQTQILNRTSGKVNIFDSLGNFRDYYDIMEDISKIYNELSDPDKADLTEILFGKQRGNQGAALIQAFQSGQIQKALEATLNAEGSAMDEQERWLGSLEAKTQQFEAAFQSLSNTVVDSDLLKNIVDLGTKGVSSFEGIVKVLETINSLWGHTDGILGAIGAASGFIMNRQGIGERTMFQW